MPRIRYASCRICAGQCGLRIEVDDRDQVIDVRGDDGNPVTLGYACSKGITLPEAHNDPSRLLHPLKRTESGTFERIGWEQVFDEIAARVRELMDRHGPDAIAGFRGTMNYSNLVANHLLPEWLACLGSTSFFSTMTIDQSAKWVTFERLGGWAAGRDPLATADVLLWIGTNPLVSLSTFNFDLQHPVQRLRDAKARGLKLIVIDPRRTETARHADVFLQLLPGEDVTVVAGLLRMILERGWHDAAFCARWVDGLDALRTAVAPFTPDYVARRAGVDPEALAQAASLFAEPIAGRARRGSAASGVGPDMGPHSNLAEHLVECLNAVCGRYARPGDLVANPGVLGLAYPRVAQVIPPRRSWDAGPKSRVRGLGTIFGEKMSGALADEILTPGPGQLRALFVDGGNPAIALPQQARAEDALRALDLLVVIDPFMTATGRLAHYVLPSKMMLERHDLGSRDYEVHVMQRPYAQYSEPVLPAPADVVDDWEVFYEIARRLGVPLTLDGEPIDMSRKPSTEELLRILMRRSSVPFSDIRAATRGRVFDVASQVVLEADPKADGRFAVAPSDIVVELGEVAAEQPGTDPRFPLRLAVRRLRDVQNTMYHTLPSVRRRLPGNSAYAHPVTLDEAGLADGAWAEAASPRGTIRLPVRADPDMRPGVVAIPHGWGDLLDVAAEGRAPGANVNRLTSAVDDCDPINAMPRLTGLPLRLRPVPAQADLQE